MTRLLALLGLCLLLALTASAQADITVEILLDDDYLIIYIPSAPPPVSLQGFAIETVIDGERQMFRLQDYPIFEALRFDNLPTPLCLRLRLEGAQPALPQVCEARFTLDQPLAVSDIFWYDAASAGRRTLMILGGTTNAFCAPGSVRCEITYLPLTFTPMPSLVATSTGVATPQPVPLTPLNRNDDWTPVFGMINGIEVAEVPAGCFLMGSEDANSDEQPIHEQCFDEYFLIGRTEVTNAQFAPFVASGGYTDSTYWTQAGWEWLTISRIAEPLYWTDNRFNAPQQPVIGISWYEAAAFAVWAGGRLPTEAEWEYAARGVESWVYSWGNEWDGSLLNWCDADCDLDWRDASVDDDYRYTAPVGSYSSESWVGALDMLGNVWEWTSTLYTAYPYMPNTQRDDPEVSESRVLRGGSWYDFVSTIRASSRFSRDLHFRNDNSGLRLAWSMGQAAPQR
jgi:formylglycine-generating enzyme required for sulfatase activity